MTTYLRGIKAEEIACSHLQQKGYILQTKRYSMYGGEIDLLMTDGLYLVAIEVRLRKNIDLAAQSINTTKKQRLTKTLQHYIMHHQNISSSHPYLRFDVVLIDHNAKICHIINAFEGEYNENNS